MATSASAMPYHKSFRLMIFKMLTYLL